MSQLCYNYINPHRICYATYNNKKAIINAKRPVASANAKPKIAYENNCPLKAGFLATPKIKAPNTIPIPIPAPIKPVVAIPVPMIFAVCIICKKKITLNILFINNHLCNLKLTNMKQKYCLIMLE